ncbi:MAG: ATP-dependent zinc metalloprotease FtsH [Lentisphaeria bacterium]|jgi:cell division protease FtsH
MADDTENPRSRRQGSGRKFPSPMKHLAFWAVLLFLGPVMMLMTFRGGVAARVVELKAAEFEELLRGRRIHSVTLEEQQSSSVQLLVGEFWPEDVPLGSAEGLRAYRSKVIYTDSFDKMLRESGVMRDVRSSNNLLLNIILSLLPIVLLIGVFYFLFSRQIRSANRGAMQFGKSRARMLNPSVEKVTFKDVAGITEAKDEMQEIVEYLKAPQRFQRLGGRIPRGVLMVGPPGTGKTLLAKAIAGEADVPFFSISGSDFVEMFVGVGASRVRDMFEEGKKHAPCLIFIDEIDAVGRSRFSGIGGGHDEREQTLNALLVEMDGFEANSGVIVLAATNRPDVLDPALLRPGRFDRQIAIDLPDLRGRYDILCIHAKKIALDPAADMQVIARGTPGFSGADLANLINEAALLATRLNKETVGMAELEESRDKVRWGKERRSRKIDEKDRRITAYHEAGHALVGILCEHSEPLHKVTIIPRGVAYLGATMQLPQQDRYTISCSELLDAIAVAMGGRVAEKLIFNELTSGASMDIRHATDIAKKMVCQWGMSEKMGPLNYIGREEHIFLGRDITRSEDYSPETAREIDLEIRRLVEESEARVTDLLTEHRDKLELLAETLLSRETMQGSEVYELLGMPMPEIKSLADDLDDLEPNGGETEKPTETADGSDDATAAVSAAEEPDKAPEVSTPTPTADANADGSDKPS